MCGNPEDELDEKNRRSVGTYAEVAAGKLSGGASEDGGATSSTSVATTVQRDSNGAASAPTASPGSRCPMCRR